MNAKGKILYIDDEADNLNSYSLILKHDGFTVETAFNSKEAFHKLEYEQPDILLVDVGLRNESGLDILKQVKADQRFMLMLVVLITGQYKDSDYLSNGLESGADGYIVRPIGKREFLARINAFMRHKRTMTALEKSEKRFHKIINKTPDAILIVDKDGKIKFSNPAAENLFQISADKLMQYLFGYPLIIGEHTEINIVRKDRNELVGEMRTIDIDWDDENAFLTSIRDVTENRILWNALLHAKEKAEESDQLKSAFLANMSHEIRTPMNGILGFAELLRDANLDREEQKLYLSIIEKSGERMLAIINDIIDISKIEAGLMEVCLSETNINELIEYIYIFFKPQCEQKGIKLSFHNPLPAKDVTINTDREKIYAIFTNLVKNAIKYSDKGNIDIGYTLKPAVDQVIERSRNDDQSNDVVSTSLNHQSDQVIERSRNDDQSSTVVSTSLNHQSDQVIERSRNDDQSSTVVSTSLNHQSNQVIERSRNDDQSSTVVSTSLNHQSEQAKLEFYVKDTGIGIPQNRQEVIFERFIQADVTDKHALQGAGLGLAISKAYVEMLGGNMTVESETDKGSTFYFSIPLNLKNADDHGYKNSDSKNQKVDENIKLKILIAEDDTTSELFISRAVKMFSRDIIMVKTGLDAVESCRNNQDIDLVLMDIRMPLMDGYEATQQIRQFDKNVIIIAQTAFALTGDREKALAAGCNDYIAKPIKKEVLINLINKFFRK